MGTDYTFNLAISFKFIEKDLVKAFGRKTIEQSHHEERFDPKTGKKIDDELVIDEEEELGLLCFCMWY